MHIKTIIALFFLSVTTSGCNLMLRGIDSKNRQKVEYIFLESYEKYGKFTKILTKNLKKFSISAKDTNEKFDKTIPIIKILDVSEKTFPSLILDNGEVGVKKMVVSAKIVIQLGEKKMPYTIKTSRSFLTEENHPTGSESEKDILREESYQYISEKIINQIFALYSFNR
ncbi:hypothetical protein [bacterium endosymbiont of Pedicinus badii]|uniref:hypothetical protein n=1 Tax=bacterium endosymbiont of Pedicinus badii TaxID=1719126 RepID=UPI0009BB77AE|nr:hypothetical protein [bacterium endosymbiont of Pedicinus badii]OQM34310.1 hypothetical protein AOQ89_00205 [bacterium endosymbiont of Pedicinus badii]